jgi:HSP20 family protein
MAQRLPEGWRQAVARLRDDIYAALDHWLHKRQTGLVQPNGHETTEHHAVVSAGRAPFWSPALCATGNLTLHLEETDDDLIVIADLPGLDRNDFTVELTGERLVIRGEKQHAAAQQGHGYFYAERRSGTFAQALQLPCEIDPEHAQATYTKGSLRVTLPKTARAKANRMRIRVQDEKQETRGENHE